MSIHVAAVGPYGVSVADALHDSLRVRHVTHVGTSRIDASGAWAHARVHVLASWRPCHQLCCDLEALCYERSATFVPVMLDAPHVIVGPVVAPGAGACFTCYRKRLLQHSARPLIERALWASYDADPLLGPVGHLSVLADLAAVRLEQLLGDGMAGVIAAAGQVWHINYLTRATARGCVTGIHGCPRCGLQRDERTRSVAELQPYLAAMRRDTGASAADAVSHDRGDSQWAVTS